MAFNRSVLWVDVGGRSTITLIRTSTGGNSIEGDIVALMNGDWFNEWEGTLNVNGSVSVVNAQYPTIQSQATCTFICADGTVARVDIPAPKLSIFLADGVTVDSTKIATLIADCIGNLLSSSGSPAVSFAAGFLNRRP